MQKDTALTIVGKCAALYRWLRDHEPALSQLQPSARQSTVSCRVSASNLWDILFNFTTQDLDKAAEYLHTCSPLTFTIWFQISVDRRGLAVTENWPAGRGLRTGAEAHVGRWGDLLPKGGEFHGAWGHGYIVRFMHWL